jgi:hypothetical protein
MQSSMASEILDFLRFIAPVFIALSSANRPDESRAFATIERANHQLLIDMNSRKWDRLNEYVDKSSWIRGSS